MLTLNAKFREERGEKSNILRKNDYLPGIVYGKEIGSLPIKVNYKDFERTWQKTGEGTVINFKLEKKEKTSEYPVLIRAIQKDPLSEKFLHVDFYQLPMDREVEVTVPLIFEGEAPAQRDLGGVLIKNLHEIKIKALPKNLIAHIKVNVSSLTKLYDSTKIKDLSFPKDIKILADTEDIVVLVGKAEEEKIEAVPEEKKPEEIGVVGKEKKEEEEEKKEGKKVEEEEEKK
ncbi:MAG: 50S ribosomal protein L25 [Parcubacteria group bacterium CG07_land_8_20_14_0_80_35_11]|nr:MAG: 50S ribosomal protein L25 [Parcubacteria group bacterium CG07_land_8_20_14_0_80_35_11]